MPAGSSGLRPGAGCSLSRPSRWRGSPCAVLAVILAAFAFVARDIARGPFDAGHALWFGALFLTVLWAKATLLEHYPVPVPFWDQWDGEAATLYIPWWHDGLSWRQMFMLHNEHRIFFSRVLAVSLLVVNGQWDPHLQILVNAVVQSLAALVFAAALWMSMGRQRLPLVICTIGLVFAPPFALENSLAGFQSAFYFLLLFSALAIWLMTAHRAGHAGVVDGAPVRVLLSVHRRRRTLRCRADRLRDRAEDHRRAARMARRRGEPAGAFRRVRGRVRRAAAAHSLP